MDPRNCDIMAASHRLMDVSEPYMLLSGYRSPKTNAMLRSKSARRGEELAAHEGPGGRPAAEVAFGRADGQGGCGLCVGWRAARYSRSNFVHMDCGPVRSWGG